MSNEEIESLIGEAELELGLEVGDTKEDKIYMLENYKDLKLSYEEKLNKFEKGTKARKYMQYELDIQLDGYEGKISPNDASNYKNAFHELTYYYANKDDEINARRALQQIDSKLLQLKAERIYNGKLLNDPSEIERITEQLSNEKINVEQKISEAVEYQNDCLGSLTLSMAVLAETNSKYSEFKSELESLIYENFSSNNPKLTSKIDEICNLLETNAIDLENKKEYLDNKKRYGEIQEEMDKIRSSLSHKSDQLSNLQKLSLKRQYKDLYKEKVDLQNDTPIDITSDEKDNQNENTSSMKKEEEKDYSKLVAAQNESNRRLKIKKISNTLSDENIKKKAMAIISGICFAGLMAAVHFSGIDPKEAITTEIQSLNSFDSLKEYIGTFTPAMWGTMIATATSLSSFIKHKKNYNKANQEFYDMMDNRPEDYQDIVESQAKSR